MIRLQSFIGRIFLILIPLFFPVHSIGKGTRQKKNMRQGIWKFDMRTGYGAFLSEVPAGFLDRLNGVNIPVRVYSPIGVFAFRRELSPHFEMGYQLDYTQVNGFVNEDDKTFPGRAVRYLPAPPQTRTSGFPAYGSSKIGFAEI